MQDHDQFRYYRPYSSPNDPCAPIPVKRYVVPPNQYVVFQPSNFPQYTAHEALRRGTLWPPLYSPYPCPDGMKGGLR